MQPCRMGNDVKASAGVKIDPRNPFTRLFLRTLSKVNNAELKGDTESNFISFFQCHNQDSLDQRQIAIESSQYSLFWVTYRILIEGDSHYLTWHHKLNLTLNVCFLLKHNIGDCIVHFDGLYWPDYLVLVMPWVCNSAIWNLYRQEEQGEAAEAAAAAAGTGEDLSLLTAYNRRLRATQSPN